ncbi:Tripartite motif-containing protein 16 [Labeo rohita]|uniref:Tripartite motif-containing protein 16 n=1 Tax=Labeo rohita TaxID=84645 RepID=A0ABQ8M5E9_LABRO|nr:Tripartite motif-containing protein 16 [Labeo rohita]
MGTYRCPQCRKTFTQRPGLGKNVMLAEMLEKVKKTEFQDAVPTRPGDEFHPGKRHKVIDATGRLKEMICQKHNKILELFCCTDQKCKYIQCTMDEHRNHETVSVAEEKTNMQDHFREMQKTIQQKIQKKEMKLQELIETVESHKRSAQAMVGAIEKIFTDLIRSIERSRSEVTQMIRAQEKASVGQAEERLEWLKQEIADLRRKKAELEQLSGTDDHIHLLQSFQSLSLTGSSKFPRIIISSAVSFDEVGKSVSKLRDQIKDYCIEAIDNIFGTDFHQFTVDPNTTNKNLSLSDRNRTITSTYTDQLYPAHPDRFDSVVQVLCRESVSGHCYWEFDCVQNEHLGVSVSYKGISRKGRGNECKFGHNNQSWTLLCSPPKYIFLHNNIKTKFIVASSSSRLGVYVDHDAGILSFYSISDKMTLIHKVHSTFTQPLYLGFSLGSNTTKCTKVAEKNVIIWREQQSAGMSLTGFLR